MTREEILKKEKDIIEMKKSINRLEESLSNDKVVEEIYDVGKIRENDQGSDGEVEDEKIASRIAEIKNLDKLLKIKAEEVKTAKQARLREAEESTQFLMELSKSETSEAVKNNSEQFLRLLQNEVNDHAVENGVGKVKVMRRDKATNEEASKKPGTFIERNIQLAKCGDGVLSLTDEEKLRLKNVLEDIDDSVPHPTHQTPPDCIPTDNQYTLNDKMKKALEEIDRKLEEHEKTKFSMDSIRGSMLSTTRLREDGKDDKIKSKIQGTVDKELKRLKEVDKLLNSLNSATNEVIDPLIDEDLQYLIEESRQLLCASTEGDLIESTRDNLQMPSKEKMTELVTAAKTGMPNFRFRYEY